MTKRIGNIVIIEVEESQQCDDCGKIVELRPYGPDGSKICHPCSQKAPRWHKAKNGRIYVRGETVKLCSVPGCANKPSGSICNMHRLRLRATGNFGPAGYIIDPRRTVAERVYPRLILAGVSVEWDCWEWSGAQRRGYGTVRVGKKIHYVHRWVYEDMIHPIPEGLLLDHTCLNRICANPYHLDPVTDAENKRRGGHWHGERHAA